MASKPLLHFAIWTTAATLASAAEFTLPSDITNSIPACALDCFESFVSNNYDVAGCGGSLSLPCLCQKPGKSGFTIGEGGVQCLVAEISRKSCEGADASQQAISKVYTMCSGVQNAAPETHATIVATLVVPSGTGPVQVPGSASTTILATPVSASTSTSEGATITPIATMSSTISSVSPGTTTTPAPSPTVVGTSTSPPLNTAQIAGISVGIAATLCLAIGLIFLARCFRKRNFGDQESAFFKPMQESKGFGMLKSNQSSPRALQISAPIHKTPVDMEFRRPGDFRNPRLETIGVALSPTPGILAAGTAQSTRAESPMGVKQPSKTYIPYTPGALGPPKPALTLAIPQNTGQTQKEARMVQSSRDSVMTEFQEDGEGESIGGSNIWRPPPTDPQSTTTYYVADKWGNWVLSNKDTNPKAAELSSPMDRTRAERAMDAMPESPVDKTGLSKPAPAPPPASAGGLGPPGEFQQGGQALRSSSVYSDPSVLGPLSVAPGLRNPPPPKLALPTTYVTPRRQNSAAGRKGQETIKAQRPNRRSRPNRHRSQDSATTIASSAADVNEEEDMVEDEPQDDLSPVVESPRTPISPGRSPVSYPKIRTSGQEKAAGRRPQEPKELPTPPKALQPALALFPRPARNELLDPPSQQPNPTLGVATVSPLKVQRKTSSAQTPGTAKQQSTRLPPLSPNHLRNPAEITTGSPETRTGSAPPEGERHRRPFHLHQQQGKSSVQQQQQPQYQQSTRPDPYPAQVRGNSGSSVGEAKLGAGGPPDRILISRASATTNGSVDSAGSSLLLTKRLGADRAAALTLGEDLRGQSARRVKWQREQGGPGFVGQDTAVALPATPGWLPKLTPTRRGDDLFLNVQ